MRNVPPGIPGCLAGSHAVAACRSMKMIHSRQQVQSLSGNGNRRKGKQHDPRRHHSNVTKGTAARLTEIDGHGRKFPILHGNKLNYRQNQ
jgi:hypothetical protein